MEVSKSNSLVNNGKWLSDLSLLFLGLMLFYLLWLGGHALLTPDEARYSEIAREMVISKDYITPRLNGVIFLDKPILYYWLQASAIKVLGLNEWSLRIWPALIGIIGCLFIYTTGRLLFNRRTGILAALILATCPLYFGMAHYANLDLEVAVFISCSLCAFIVGIEQQSNKKSLWLLLAYMFAGFAILTKGMIGLVFPMMIIGVWIILLNYWRVIKQMRLISGLLIIFLMVAPWYFLVQKANPAFLNHFFLNQQYARFLSNNFNNAQPCWFYAPIVLLGVFPWLVFLPQTILSNYRLIKQNKQLYKSELFLLLWPLLIFVFFSIPHSKTIGYITPVIPPLALLIGRYLDRYWHNTLLDKLKAGLKLFICLLVTMIIAEVSLSIFAGNFHLNSIKPLALTINRLAKPEDKIISYYKYYQDLPLYTQRRVMVVENWNSPTIFQGDSWRREISDYFRSPLVRQWLITAPEFWKIWHSKQRLFVLVNEPETKQFELQANPNSYRLAEYQNIILFTNQPLS